MAKSEPVEKRAWLNQPAPFAPGKDASERKEYDGAQEEETVVGWRAVVAGVFGAGLVAVVVVIPRYGEGGPWRAVVRAQAWSVSSRIDGTVARVFVRNGRSVRRGDLLAELDVAELEIEGAAARRQLTQGKADLLAIGIELAIGKADLQELRAAMSVRGEALGATELNYLATRKVAGRKNVSVSGSRASEKAFAEALASYLKANQTFSRAADLLEEKQAAGAALEVNFQRTEASLRDVNWRLGWAKIYAPVEGKVVFDKAIFGEPITAGKPFLKVLAGEPWVVADLDTAQLRRIRAGTRATIVVEGVKGRTFYGQVDSVGAAVYVGRRGWPSWSEALPFFQCRETAPVRITFEAGSLLGFEDLLEPGLTALVECSPESPLTATHPDLQDNGTAPGAVAGN